MFLKMQAEIEEADLIERILLSPIGHLKVTRAIFG
jgi:hypothetical protein